MKKFFWWDSVKISCQTNPLNFLSAKTSQQFGSINLKVHHSCLNFKSISIHFSILDFRFQRNSTLHHLVLQMFVKLWLTANHRLFLKIKWLKSKVLLRCILRTKYLFYYHICYIRKKALELYNKVNQSTLLLVVRGLRTLRNQNHIS